MTLIGLAIALLIGLFAGFCLGALAADQAGRHSCAGWMSPREIEAGKAEARAMAERLAGSTKRLQAALDAAHQSRPA